MAKIPFVWDYKAAGELLLKSDAIADVCIQQAERMTRATGMKYKPKVYVGKRRVNDGGYQESISQDGENICPKCGDEHPNCRCNRRKK